MSEAILGRLVDAGIGKRVKSGLLVDKGKREVIDDIEQLRGFIGDVIEGSAREKILKVVQKVLQNASDDMAYHNTLPGPYPAHVAVSLGNGLCMSVWDQYQKNGTLCPLIN